MQHNAIKIPSSSLTGSYKWLTLTVLSLLSAGLLTFVVVFSRTPLIKEFFIFKDFFNKALVAHVDLSQLYFMALSAIFLNYCFFKLPKIFNQLSFTVALSSILMVIITTFLSNSSPILNNYIPVLEHPLFSIALALFFFVMLANAFMALYQNRKIIHDNIPISALTCYNLIICLAFFNLYASHIYIEKNQIIAEYYEILFWGFGHVLQFANVVLLVFCWWLILERCNIKHYLSSKVFSYNLAIHFALALLTAIFFTQSKLDIYSFKQQFTNHMIYFGSVLVCLIFLFIIPSLNKLYKKNNSLFEKSLLNCLCCSALLFFYGGFLGLLIKESNTMIPAHYHGSTIGITIALLGMIYLFLDKLTKLDKIAKLIFWQPIIYVTGQLIHITGLAVSGGYGALRKAPDSIHGFSAKFWMGVMGTGGLITMIAGVLFFIICYKALKLYNNEKIKGKKS